MVSNQGGKMADSRALWFAATYIDGYISIASWQLEWRSIYHYFLSSWVLQAPEYAVLHMQCKG